MTVNVPTTTLSAATTTATATPPTPRSVLDDVNWIQIAVASPCTTGTVQLTGGSAVQGGVRAVLDDIVPVEPATGYAIAFLSCRDPRGLPTETTAVLVEASPSGFAYSHAEVNLGARARVVRVSADGFTTTAPDPAPPSTLVRSPVRVRTYSVSAEGIELVGDVAASAFDETVPDSAAIGRDVELIRSSVSPQSLCYRWRNPLLSPPATGAEPPPLTEPTADLQTIRLGLIVVTGQWIEPTSEMSRQMSDIATDYQVSRDLVADGIIGPQTTGALGADLGCPDPQGFRQVDPPELGPRRFATVTELVARTTAFARTGTSGNASLDALLAAAGWDGRLALYLGCRRYDQPRAGLACTWSGPTPLVLVGLVSDPGRDDVADFSVLYARSAA